MSGIQTAISILALLSVGGIATAFFLICRLRRLSATSRAGEKDHGECASDKSPAPAESFRNSLIAADLKKSLQEERGSRLPPEKYRYAASLAGKGMNSREIGEIFRLSPAEAEQLVRLSRMALKS